MAGSEVPGPDSLNAPKIPYWLYSDEKDYFSGFSIGAIFYGIAAILFFQCMGTLLDPVNPIRGGIKWGLVVHTTAMFSFTTIYTALNLSLQSTSFIDNRGFLSTSTDGVTPSGPVIFEWFNYYKPISATTVPMIVLNNWLADGLLLYRCYVVYARSRWVIVSPSLMFLASLATGILFIYENSRSTDLFMILNTTIRFGTPYFSISFALNILLTFMIVTRLVLHRKNIQNAMGSTTAAGGLYETAITILVESSALGAIAFLPFVGLMAVKSPVQYIFLQALAQIQVISPFLIILRVANRRALTSEVVVSRSVSSMCFGSRGTPVGGYDTLCGESPINSKSVTKFCTRAETTTELHKVRASESEGTLRI